MAYAKEMKLLSRLTQSLYEKIWMTLGLGVFFGSFYLVMTEVLLTLDLQTIVNHGMQGALHTIPYFFLWGLVFAIYISVLVYIVRRLIIRLFLFIHR